jgi:hypothetical protein
MEPTVEGQSSVTQPTNTVDSAPVTPPTEKTFDPNKTMRFSPQEINPALPVAARSENTVAATVSTEAVAVQSAPNIPEKAEQVQFLKPAEIAPSAPVSSVDAQSSATATPTTEKKSVVSKIKSFFGI